jgi:hypothetical protein
MLVATLLHELDQDARRVVFENERFEVEGRGPITARQLLTYDQEDRLRWAHEGLRGMVQALAEKEATLDPEVEMKVGQAPPTGDETVQAAEAAPTAEWPKNRPKGWVSAGPVGQAGVVSQASEGLCLVHDEQVAVLPIEIAGAMLGVAKMIVERGENRERKFNHDRIEDLQTFSERLRASIGDESHAAARIDLSAEERAIVNLLYLQTMARADLECRVRHQCCTCNQVTVTNPEYDSLVKRNRLMMTLARSVGIAVVTGGVAPFFMASSLLGFVKLDPDFVCPNCRGMQDEESIRVYCPERRCRAPHDEVLLDRCKCGHDFTADADLAVLWQPAAAVPLLPAAADAGTLLLPQDVKVTGLAFSPDGQCLALALADGTVALRDAGDVTAPADECLVYWKTHIPARTLLTASADGRRLAAFTPCNWMQAGYIWVLETKYGSSRKLPSSWSSLGAAAFDPQGQRLAFAEQNGVQIWDVQAMKRVAYLNSGLLAYPTRVAFSPDGARVATDSGSNSTLVWSLATKKKVAKLPMRSDVGLAWSPDGRLVGASGTTVCVCDVGRVKLARSFQLTERVTLLALSHDGSQFVAACADNSARLYDLNRGAEVARIPCPGPISAITLSSGGRVALGLESGGVQLWAPKGCDPVRSGEETNARHA